MEFVDLRPVHEAYRPQNLHPPLRLKRSASRVFIEGLSELEAHLRLSQRKGCYQAMLRDFGIASERLRDLDQRPRLVYAEQPGGWFSPHDRLRGILVERLVSELGHFDRLASGHYYLANDAFTATGDKQMILWFDLHRELDPVRFLGSRFIRRHRRRTYASLSIQGPTYERMRAIFSLSESLLEGAAISPRAFARTVKDLLGEGLTPGLSPLLPESLSNDNLASFGHHLRSDYHLLDAYRHLRQTGRCLVPGMSWVAFWTEVNRRFHETSLRALDPLLNQFVLAIEDPVRMARQLIHCCELDIDEPVSIVGIVTAKNIYRMVHYDPRIHDFFYEIGTDSRRSISWEEVQTLALEGKTGGPAGALEYLLFAAAGLYMVVDSADSIQPFHHHACQIHRHYTGLKYPWMTVGSSGAPHDRRTGGSYMDIYHKGFQRQCERLIDHILTS